MLFYIISEIVRSIYDQRKENSFPLDLGTKWMIKNIYQQRPPKQNNKESILTSEKQINWHITEHLHNLLRIMQIKN